MTPYLNDTFDTAYAVRQVTSGRWWSREGEWGPFGSVRVYDTGPRALSAYMQSNLYVEGEGDEVEVVEISVRVTSLWCAVTT